MINIENLCEFIRLLIKNEDSGILFPQNSDYIKTSEIVNTIAEIETKRIIFFKFLNPLIYILLKYFEITEKVFGTLIYDKKMSEYRENYYKRNLKESIILPESEFKS